MDRSAVQSGVRFDSWRFVRVGYCTSHLDKRHSVRLIHFKAELGSNGHLIVTDGTFETVEKKKGGGGRQIIMDEYFYDAIFTAQQQLSLLQACIWRAKPALELLSTIKCPRSLPLSLSCQSVARSGLSSNQSHWLGVSGSSCFKQAEVEPVATPFNRRSMFCQHDN